MAFRDDFFTGFPHCIRLIEQPLSVGLDHLTATQWQRTGVDLQFRRLVCDRTQEPFVNQVAGLSLVTDPLELLSFAAQLPLASALRRRRQPDVSGRWIVQYDLQQELTVHCFVAVAD